MKPAAEIGEQRPRAERARQEAGERDHDHLGDQIGGLHPGDLVGARREPGLNLGQRGRHDLDVQDRHEHAEHHRQEGEQAARLDMIGRGATAGSRGPRGPLSAWGNCPWAEARSGCRRSRLSVGRRWSRPQPDGHGAEPAASALVLMLTTTDMPGRSSSARPRRSAGTSMRTGTRCTILVKLPVALSGGSRENTEPEAGATLTTCPSWCGRGAHRRRARPLARA